jgi:hypothetical protein
MKKTVLAALAVTAIGFAATASGSAHAGAVHLAPEAVLSLQSDVMEVATHQSKAPKFSSPRIRSAPGISSPKIRSAPKLSSQRSKPAPKISSHTPPKLSSKKPPKPPRFTSHKPATKWVGPRHPPRYLGWSLDRRHRYYGAYFLVPFGIALYASHYCYDWTLGPYGWGYYWNYDRCPVY